MRHRVGIGFLPAALAALILSLLPCISSGAGWSQIITGPSPRYGHAMAYDSARGVTVLFGGWTSGSGESGETWEWNGSVWTLKSTTGPSPREDHAMAYDSARGVTVLFGGSSGGGETWEWNGSVWTLKSTRGGPSPRGLHAMAYDSARGVTVLFGGNISTYPYYNGETWEWDGAVWTRKSTTGPSPRRDHAMAYDSARGVTILFGGVDSQSNYNGETWEWDGSVWTLKSTTGPSPRYGHAMAFDGACGVTVLFGGYTSASPHLSGETWEWDGSVWTLKSTTGPSPRNHHTMAYDSARGVTILFGGATSNFVYSGETWEWNDSTWTLKSTTGPSPRIWHAMAYDSARGVTVLFGGARGSVSNGETWEYALTTAGEVKTLADGLSVSLPSKTVTAVFDDCFYIEETARYAGIRVVPTAMPSELSEGKIVNVVGKVRTSSDGERYIDGSAAIVGATDLIEPLGLTNRALGGGAFGLQEGIAGGFGLNNIGLLVKVWGRVTASGSDPRDGTVWFYMDDGGNVNDGTGITGIYAEAKQGISVPEPGAYIYVTGISSCEFYQGKLVNLLRPRGQEDIVVISDGSGEEEPPPPGIAAKSDAFGPTLETAVRPRDR